MSSMEPTTTQYPNSLIGENYNFTLKQSIQKLVTETHEKAPNFSNYTNTFYELMQAKTDPPLETIWVYSALSFRSRETSGQDLSDRVAAAEELFRLITACSASCNGSKSIALLAPVVLELYDLVVELLGNDSSSKKVKKVNRKVKSLIGVVIGYVGVCCCSEDLSAGSDLELIVGVEDLVNVWRNGNLDEFFPLASDEIRMEVGVSESSVSFLAGVVIAEVFLLKLCLDLRVGTRGEEMEKELRSWVVGSITGFQSFYFYEALARMMMEPSLPVTSILSSEDENFLRKLLYDATVLVEYSFLGPEQTNHLPAEHVTSLAVRRMIITLQAMEFFRKAHDQKRAISCSSSYSSSRLHSQIVDCITSQIGSTEEASKLSGSSPKSLIKWLRALEGHGIRLFDESISKHLAKLDLDYSKSDLEQTAAKLLGNDDHLFYIDNKGDEKEMDEDEDDGEANESMNAAFVAAAHSMSFKETMSTKRKEGGSNRKKKRAKLLKDDHSEDSDSDRVGSLSASESNNSSNTESEVENPTSDEEM